MLFLGPTDLRTKLFDALETVKNGETVCITTRTENLYIVSQKQFDRLSNPSRAHGSSQKLKGKIIGNLEDADKELKEYLNLPK